VRRKKPLFVFLAPKIGLQHVVVELNRRAEQAALTGGDEDRTILHLPIGLAVRFPTEERLAVEEGNPAVGQLSVVSGLGGSVTPWPRLCDGWRDKNAGQQDRNQRHEATVHGRKRGGMGGTVQFNWSGAVGCGCGKALVYCRACPLCSLALLARTILCRSPAAIC